MTELNISSKNDIAAEEEVWRYYFDYAEPGVHKLKFFPDPALKGWIAVCNCRGWLSSGAFDDNDDPTIRLRREFNFHCGIGWDHTKEAANGADR